MLRHNWCVTSNVYVVSHNRVSVDSVCWSGSNVGVDFRIVYLTSTAPSLVMIKQHSVYMCVVFGGQKPLKCLCLHLTVKKF